MSEKTKTSKDFETLEIARKVLEALPPRNLKKETAIFYMKTADTFFRNLDAVNKTGSKRTYYLRKAALTYAAEIGLRKAVATGSASQAAEALKVLARFYTPPIQNRSDMEQRTCPLLVPQKRVSKRLSLRDLPVDWREQLLEAAPNRSVELWLLVMAVTGARPSELARGVEIRPVVGGVQVTIKGTKTDRGHGQPLRVFEVRSELAVRLASIGASTVRADSANQISVALGRLGRRVFGQFRQHRVSAYSLRHQFAADLKASGCEGDQISAALGHSVSDTKRHYGKATQSRGPIRVRLVHASRPVKQTRGITNNVGRSSPSPR